MTENAGVEMQACGKNSEETWTKSDGWKMRCEICAIFFDK